MKIKKKAWDSYTYYPFVCVSEGKTFWTLLSPDLCGQHIYILRLLFLLVLMRALSVILIKLMVGKAGDVHLN